MPDQPPLHPGPTRPRRAGLALVAAGAVLLVAVLVGVVTGGSRSASPSGAARPVGATTAPAPAPAPTQAPTHAPERSGPLTVVALGDSVPSATTCDCQGYVEQLGVALQAATHRPTRVHNDAVSGWTTQDVEDDLDSGPTRADLSNADLVLIEVGANDFDLSRITDPSCFPVATSPCWQKTLTDLRAELLRITQRIRAIDANPLVRIAALGYWNISVDGRVGRALGAQYMAGSDELTRATNATIAGAAKEASAVYVDAYTGFKGDTGTRDPTDDLLEDGDHPNGQGYTLLMEAVLDSLQRHGAVTAWTAAR